jgi:DNA-binding response OmpR family regulator
MARILVIDDEANIRLLVRLALQKNGHAVEQAGDGPEGLEKFAEGKRFDLVLLDQRMPGLEGLDVLREILRRERNARVIMVTAFGTIDLVVDAMKAGAKDFLRKPFTLETLHGAVEAALADLPPIQAPTAAVELAPRFSFTTLNGFHIEAVRTTTEHRNGEIRQVLTVRKPNGDHCVCEVHVMPVIAAAVKEQAGVQALTQKDSFWQGFCGEALANYMWQHSEIPIGGVIRVDEYTSNLRRWAAAAGSTSGPVDRLTTS